MSSGYVLSVVIPVHNSATVLASTMRRWTEYLTTGSTEIIVVENGSTDDTWALAQELAVDTPTVHFTLVQSEKGMGNALRAGILASHGDSVLLSADDLPFGFDDLEAAARLDSRPTVVIGSKAHPDSNISRAMSRRMFTFGYRVLRFLILRSRVGDPQGTIIVDGPWVRAVAPDLTEPGFLFTTQLVLVAEKRRLEVVEVPVTLYASHAPKESSVRWADVIEMGRGLSRVGRRVRRLNDAHATDRVER